MTFNGLQCYLHFKFEMCYFRGSWKRGYQVRKPSYLVGESEHDANYRTLQEHARIQVASRYQSQPVATREAVGVTPAVLNHLQSIPYRLLRRLLVWCHQVWLSGISIE